jgi:hypothetical protein
VTLVLGFGLLLTVSRGGWIALGIALVVWPLSARRWRWQRRAVAAAAVVALVLGAGIILYRTAPKVRERFDFLVRQSGELSRPILWRAAWEIFRANPLAGGGAGSFNVRFEQHRPAGFRDEPQWVHNDALNTLSEYGALGLVLLLGTIVVIATRQRSMDPVPASDPLPWLESGATRHALGIGLVAFGLQTLVDFHLKIPALAMTGALLAALAMGAPESGTTATASSLGRWNRIRWLLAAVVVVTALFPILRFYRAEALRYRARQTIDVLLTRRPADVSARLQAVELTLQRATSLAPRHAGAWAELAHVVALRAWAAPALGAALAAPAVAAARRATELAPIVPEFWMRLGVALDLAARPDEARGAFEKATRLAPHSSNAWYYYAYHLSHDTEQREPALRAIATCLSLDPGNAAAEALRVKLTERRSGAPFNP